MLKVAATSKPVLVAGAIAGVIRTHSRAELHAIGAAAVNQAIKAIAISRGYVAPEGLDLVCIPSFIDLSLDGQERTGIRLLVSGANARRAVSSARSARDARVHARNSKAATPGPASEVGLHAVASR